MQLAESSVVTDVKRNFAKWVEAGHCTAGVLFFVLIACLVTKFSSKK